ncbi:MAG: histidine kinase [Crocinitomicaceae bacterium]
MSKKQIKEISNLLLEYSAGNYEYQGVISDKVNELDMIISGINMLGEELRSTHVSKDYFSSIFNAVTDLVMVVAEDGQLIDINKSAEETLGLKNNKLFNIKLDHVLHQSNHFFEMMKSQLESGEKPILLEHQLIAHDQSIIHGQFTCSVILNRFEKFLGYLVSVKDITGQKENEQKILKAIFTTQQKEQKRVADDLHDSLGQELSMTKLIISNLRKQVQDNEAAKELLANCTAIIESSIKHLREICFNLMPSVLTHGGLNMALADLTKKLQAQTDIQVRFEKNPEIDRLDSDLEIVLYRISQEFINNMIKHSDATELEIELDKHSAKNEVSLFLSENGQGFDLNEIENIGENRGYNNLKTKVKAFNGTLRLNSIPGKGTTTYVKFPILPYYEED